MKRMVLLIVPLVILVLAIMLSTSAFAATDKPVSKAFQVTTDPQV